MKPNAETKPKRQPGDRPFPWPCPRCRKPDTVILETVPYTAEIAHDGRTYTLEIPRLQVPRCQACKELILGHRVDEQIRQALRAHLHLLTAQQIHDGRKTLGLSQEALAERLGVAKETISRWETGALIQSRAMDNLLRVYFAFPQVRAALQSAGQDVNLGTKVL
jgi:putative zinc finger/helix-turn-helix YgiT family protein